MKKIMMISAIFLSMNISACANTDVSHQDVGTVTGGVVGGVLGSKIGGGSGRVAATIGGTLLGAFIGGSVGQSMDELDKMKMSRALEITPTHKSVAWRNPDSGNRYRITPTRTYMTKNGQPCREYNTTVIIGGKQQQLFGTACRQSDGSWQVASSN